MDSVARDQEVKFLRELVSYYETLKQEQQQRAEVNGGATEEARELRKAARGPLLPDLEAKLAARLRSLEARRERVRELEAGSFQCPKVCFGRTGESISVVTCGGMRQQVTWSRDKFPDVASLPTDAHENFKAVMRRAVQLGINHFETARGYGSSEIQFGDTIRELIAEGIMRRGDILVQTKVPAMSTAAAFREALEGSFQRLGLDYIDFFGFHGVNRERDLDWIFDNGDESCWSVAEEFRAAGRIRHIGFSTHAITPVIMRAIETDKFDYVNLHYQWVGSYTATGSGAGEGSDSGFASTGGNHQAVRAARAHDMGVFVISPFDKGGMLYKPTTKMYNLCMPDMSPMEFEALWSWLHPDSDARMHTISVGAARPSDFDEPLLAAARFEEPGVDELVRTIDERLRQAAVEALGAEWLAQWHTKVPNLYETKTGVATHALLWCWSLIKAYGMYDYAMARAKFWHSNGKKWDPSKTYEENMEIQQWGYTPGCAFREDAVEQLVAEMTERGHPEPQRVIAIFREIHSWVTPEADAALTTDQKMAKGWGAATDQPWVPFPERA